MVLEKVENWKGGIPKVAVGARVILYLALFVLTVAYHLVEIHIIHFCIFGFDMGGDTNSIIQGACILVKKLAAILTGGLFFSLSVLLVCWQKESFRAGKIVIFLLFKVSWRR